MNKKQKGFPPANMKTDVNFVSVLGNKSFEKSSQVTSMSYRDEPQLIEDMGSVKTIRKS